LAGFIHRSSIVLPRLPLAAKVAVGGVSGCGERQQKRLHAPVSGTEETCKFPIWSLAMFKIPAYDPFAIAIMSFGILVVVALAFTF
jgi:hypothetical protein